MICRMKCKNCGNTIPDGSHYCNVCGHYLLKKPKDTISLRKPWQLPSGKWRLQMREYEINVVADTPEACKKKAQAKLNIWLHNERVGANEAMENAKNRLTLGKAVDTFIADNTPVLAASTISSYQSIRDHRFMDYWEKEVNTINFQQMIGDETRKKVKAKTIKNAWGLISKALNYAKIEFTKPSLPRAVKKEKEWLDYKQIKVFLKAIKGENCELGALLALHSLRRSEIFGLKLSNYDRKKKLLKIRGAITYSKITGWTYSELNKNDTSRRDVPILIPRLAELLDALPKDTEFFIKPSQCSLYNQINQACEKADLPQIGIHGLRHSYASLALHLGWKKLSTQQIGGWKNSKVLDEIYSHNADLETDLKTMEEYFRE